MLGNVVWFRPLDYDRGAPLNGGPPAPLLAIGMISLLDLSGLRVFVSLDEPFDGEIDSVWLEGVARAGLSSAGIAGDAEVSLLITSDETVRALNAEYRGLDETTDVLSFSSDHPGHWEGDGDGPPDSRFPGNDGEGSNFVLPPGAPRPLGEIIVSWPQAQRQAVEHGVSAERELAHLVIHGTLHLIGYDHLGPEDTPRMQALEREALDSLFILSLSKDEPTARDERE